MLVSIAAKFGVQSAATNVTQTYLQTAEKLNGEIIEPPENSI